MHAVVVAALCIAIAVVLSRAGYIAARSLLDQGVAATGIVEGVERYVEPTVGPRKSHVTTASYRFVGSDGRTYQGVSVVKARAAQVVAVGEAIAILHEPTQPHRSASRASLEATARDAHAGVFAALVLLPWLGLMLYRYARWALRRRLRAALA